LKLPGCATELITNITIGPAPRLPKEMKMVLNTLLIKPYITQMLFIRHGPAQLGVNKNKGVDVVMLGFLLFSTIR